MKGGITVPREMAGAIVAVVVLYKRGIARAESLATLIEGHSLALLQQVHLLVYANAWHPDDEIDASYVQEVQRLFASFEYIVDAGNAGIAKPYNLAWLNAIAHGCTWLLLLDQDTSLSENYIGRMLGGLDDATGAFRHVAAVVPQVVAGGQPLAPREGFFGAALFTQHDRLCEGEMLITINSGALIATKFVTDVGGFDGRYWLDGLDTWLFMKIYIAARPILLRPVRISPGLSLASVSYVDEQRMANIFKSEVALVRDFDIPLFRLKVLIGIIARLGRLLVARRWSHIRALISTAKGGFV
jgi:hypothetical protein